MDTKYESAPEGEASGATTSTYTSSQSHIAEVSSVRKPSPSACHPYLEAGFQLIPLHKWNAKDRNGRPRGKTPRDSHWQTREYNSKAVLINAERVGINIGVRLTAAVMVLDVDPRNFGEGDSLLRLMIDTGLDLRGVPQTATGSGGSHYWFKKPTDVTLLDSLVSYKGVEFKSLGRQVVSAGSVHPNGTHYFWADGLVPDLRDLPDIPATLLRLIRRPVRSHGESAGLGELSAQQLADTLEQLEPTDFSDHDEWLTLMMACHHATNGEGRQEFIDWSTGDGEYADHGWIIGRRWDSLHAESGRGGKPVTVRYLHKVLLAHGGQVARTPPEDDFEPYDVPEGTGVDDAMLRAELHLTGFEAVIDALNARHAVVMEGGKFRIFTEQHDPVLNRAFYQRSTKEDFINLYCNTFVERPNQSPTTQGHAWIKDPARRGYHGVVFDPERSHDGWLNLWKGWAVEPKAGDWSLLKQLIQEVLVDGDRSHYEYVMNWMAYMVQKPWRPAEVAIAFKGQKGTGKGTLGRALAELAGSSGLHISSPEHLTGRFNSHLQNCICLFADEAFWAGDKAGESKLKQLVTEPTLTYEGKGRDAAMGKNLIHIVMASNSDWVVPAGLDGERRFAVFAVNNGRMSDKQFFNALNAQLYANDRAGLSGMLHELLNRDLGNWAPRDNVPQTRELVAQKELSMSPEAAWWDSMLDAGELPRPFGAIEEWEAGPLLVDLPALHTLYADFVRRHHLGKAKTPKGLAMAIKEKAGVNRKQVERKWFWVIPQLDQARAIWDGVLGAKGIV